MERETSLHHPVDKQRSSEKYVLLLRRDGDGCWGRAAADFLVESDRVRKECKMFSRLEA